MTPAGSWVPPEYTPPSQATRGSSRSDGDGNWMMDGGLQGEHSWRDEALAHARPQMGMRPAPHAADVDVDAS